jgi:hypothetical protein
MKRVCTLLPSLAVLFACTLSFASPKPQTLTGVVTDAMCGATHMSGQTAAACTASCVKQGSAYALVVGDKVYKLSGKTDGLEKLAGEKATVTGTVKGESVDVQTVSAAQ